MTNTEPLILLIDDMRSFKDPSINYGHAQTSAGGCSILRVFSDRYIDELWLDHDLGYWDETDHIGPVITLLEEAAFNGEPFDIGTIYIITSNPSGQKMMVGALERWGYNIVISPNDSRLHVIDRDKNNI